MNNTILIIDDDPGNIFALTAVLKAKGFSCVSASGMEHAMNLIRETEVSIILIDMMMPVMDGYDGIPLMRTNEQLKRIPVIAVTAQAMPGDKEKCLAAGADEYITKPVDTDVLLNLLNKYLK